MGETWLYLPLDRPWRHPFSILERIDVGETPYVELPEGCPDAFSILERIDVGETLG